MRKIEQQMIEAIRNGHGFHSGNTAVTEPYGDGWQEVYLHGNRIAAVRVEGGYLQTQVDRETFRRWPTATTCSRLRALGINAYVKARVPMLNGEVA